MNPALEHALYADMAERARQRARAPGYPLALESLRSRRPGALGSWDALSSLLDMREDAARAEALAAEIGAL